MHGQGIRKWLHAVCLTSTNDIVQSIGGSSLELMDALARSHASLHQMFEFIPGPDKASLLASGEAGLMDLATQAENEMLLELLLMGSDARPPAPGQPSQAGGQAPTLQAMKNVPRPLAQTGQRTEGGTMVALPRPPASLPLPPAAVLKPGMMGYHGKFCPGRCLGCEDYEDMAALCPPPSRPLKRLQTGPGQSIATSSSGHADARHVDLRPPLHALPSTDLKRVPVDHLSISILPSAVATSPVTILGQRPSDAALQAFAVNRSMISSKPDSLATPALEMATAKPRPPESRPPCQATLPSAGHRPPLQASVPPAKRPCPDVSDASGISFALAPAKLAGLVAQHCRMHVEKILSFGPTSFKVGLTCDPTHRWTNMRYGYKLSGHFSRMLILAETATTEGAGFLEAMLIDHFSNRPGCQNKSQGGEGLHDPSAGPCFVYMVYRHL
jgi:hypothetical protein